MICDFCVSCSLAVRDNVEKLRDCVVCPTDLQHVETVRALSFIECIIFDRNLFPLPSDFNGISTVDTPLILKQRVIHLVYVVLSGAKNSNLSLLRGYCKIDGQ